jgi:O-antigen/teichoic acid export membrane protein
LTFTIECQEYEKANKEISTAVYGLVRLFVIAFFPLCALSIYIDHLIVIPPNLVAGARIFSIFSILFFILITLSGPLGAAMFVRNRLDLASGAFLARTLFFIAIIVAFFSTVGASLPIYGFAMFASSLLLFFTHIWIHKHLLKSVEISNRWFDRTILRDIMSLGGWITFSQIGGLLFLQTDLIISNRILGPTITGQLAAILVIPLQLRVFSGLVSSLFGPTQAAIAARKDWTAFSNYLLRSLRLTTLFFALVVGVFCGSAHEVLSVWLGKEFASLTPVALMLTAYLVLSLGCSPLAGSGLMLGKVKVPSIVTMVMGVGNVAICIILANTMGLMGIALSQCVMLLLLNVVFTSWYVSRICSISLRSIWSEHFIGVLCFLGITLISYGVNTFVAPVSLIMLVVSLSLSAGLGLLLLLPLGMQALRNNS